MFAVDDFLYLQYVNEVRIDPQIPHNIPVSFNWYVRLCLLFRSKCRLYTIASFSFRGSAGRSLRLARIEMGWSSNRSISCRSTFARPIQIEQSASLDLRSDVVVV
jgi:hypothetical protein